MTTIATLFSGGEGVGMGARAAGVKHLWGIEHDPGIAKVAIANRFKTCVWDVTEIDPGEFERPDILHASPPCPNFSTANANREETDNDMAISEAICRFIRVLRPDVFTLENVYGYRKSESFKVILVAMHRQGYEFRWWHLNAADYGVPQTRKRLLLVASLKSLPQRPRATHQDPTQIIDGQLGLFGEQLPPWIGWYEAIADLVPALPESQFAPWQLARLPAELRTILLGAGSRRGEVVNVGQDSPMMTVTANRNQATQLRALIVGENPNARGECREGGEPMKTIAAKPAGGFPRALLVSGAGRGDGLCVTRKPYYPATTSVASETVRPTRALLVGGQYGQPAGTPGRTVQHSDSVAFTVTASNKGDWKGFAVGRVVQMTPRALARFQSFPDWYELPDNRTLACRVIGNAVPPLLYQRVVESFLEIVR